jgi:hypothetical protein
MESSQQQQPQIDESERIRQAIHGLVQRLYEFGDVQVFCSYVDSDGNTFDVVDGMGNWNARVGIVRTFLNRHREHERMHAEMEFEEQNFIEEDSEDDFLHGSGIPES